MMASSTWAMLAVQGCLLQTWVITEQLKFQEGSGVGCTTVSTEIRLETEGSRRFFGDISAARSVSDAEWSTTSDAGFVAVAVAVSAADLTLLLCYISTCRSPFLSGERNPLWLGCISALLVG